MFDVTKFNNRHGWTIKDLAHRLFESGGESRVGMWKTGDSNPRYEAILKLIELGATAEELFGKHYADILIENSSKSAENKEIKITNDDVSKALLIAAEILKRKKSEENQ